MAAVRKLAPIAVEILFVQWVKPHWINKKIGTESGTGVSTKLKCLASKKQIYKFQISMFSAL